MVITVKVGLESVCISRLWEAIPGIGGGAMKRLYWRMAVLFLPILAMLLLFEYAGRFQRTGNPHVDEYLRAFHLLGELEKYQHKQNSFLPGTGEILGIAAVLFIAAALFDRFEEGSSQALVAQVASILNEPFGGNGGKGVRQKWIGPLLLTEASAHFQGRKIDLAWRRFPTARINQDRFLIDLECESLWTFTVKVIKRGGHLDYLVGRYATSQNVSVGDAELERHLFFVSDNPEALVAWVRQPEVRSRILSLTQQHRVSTVSVKMGDEGGFFLEAGYDSYQWWTRNVIVSNIWGVLSDMERLAFSLDRRPPRDQEQVPGYCAKCGAEIQTAAHFCVACGSPALSPA